MNRKTNTATGVHHHLEISGVLETGSSIEITECRKAYWREVKRQWKIEKKKREKEFKIYFTSKELDVIAKSAGSNGISRTKYIKEAALAHSEKRLIPNPEITHIRQLLALNYAAIQDIEFAGDNKESFQTRNKLIEQMAHLEQQVLARLCNPKTLEQWIREAIETDPNYKTTLLQLLQNF